MNEVLQEQKINYLRVDLSSLPSTDPRKVEYSKRDLPSNDVEAEAVNIENSCTVEKSQEQLQAKYLSKVNSSRLANGEANKQYTPEDSNYTREQNEYQA